MKEGKLPTSGGEGLSQNPFGALSGLGLPQGPGPNEKNGGGASPLQGGDKRRGAASANRGRVDIIRETGNRAGKTVTVVTNFIGIGLPEKEQLAKKMRASCGCGGTVKEGRIEIQGDQREAVAKILSEAGFRPVYAGG